MSRFLANHLAIHINFWLPGQTVGWPATRKQRSRQDEEAATPADSGRRGIRDLGPDNIRVNSIAPGWIMTGRQVSLWLTPEGEAELLRRQCLKRKLMPDEMARIALFLAADDSSAMTNQTYVCDGGWV